MYTSKANTESAHHSGLASRKIKNMKVQFFPHYVVICMKERDERKKVKAPPLQSELSISTRTFFEQL